MAKIVFLVSGRQTYSGRHHVSFGDNNKPTKFNKSTKSFRRWTNAKTFAVNKAKKLKLSKVSVAGKKDIPIKLRKRR